MAVQKLSAISGVNATDTMSTTASIINNHIAAMAPGDVLEWDCPVSPSGQINVTNKLGIRISGAGPMGSRLASQGNNNGMVVEGCESCVIENIGIAPLTVQTAGVGLTYDVNPVGTVIPVANIFRNIDIFDRTAQASGWSLGTGAPYKGVHVKGSNGGYNSIFDSVRVNGAVSSGWEFGTYNQSTRGSVNVIVRGRSMAARCGGDGYAVFASEALILEDDTEALQNLGRGLVVYPDNGGFVELTLFKASFDTNAGHGIEVAAGGTGAGGTVKLFHMRQSWSSNNGNPDVAPGSNWLEKSGLYVSAPVKRLLMHDNQFAVNGSHGVVIGGVAESLDIDGDEYLNNGQSVSTGGYGGNGLWVAGIPTVNKINNCLADGQAYSSYTARQLSGIVTVSGAATNATGNVSKNPNYGTPAYSWGTTLNGANNQ